MTAATRLEAALLDAAEALLEVVGLPMNPADGNSPRVPVSGSLVDTEQVPAAAHRAAVYALDVLLVGMAVMDPDNPHSTSVEEGLALMVKAGEG